tara:strand:+ start:174 stop:536 length:363 start_codon:yes stop_codon:yes gene_type:complete
MSFDPKDKKFRMAVTYLQMMEVAKATKRKSKMTIDPKFLTNRDTEETIEYYRIWAERWPDIFEEAKAVGMMFDEYIDRLLEIEEEDVLNGKCEVSETRMLKRVSEEFAKLERRKEGATIH